MRWVMLVAILVAGCGGEVDPFLGVEDGVDQAEGQSDTDADGDGDADAGYDAGDTDTAVAGDGDTDADTDGDADGDADSDSDTDADGDSDTSTSTAEACPWSCENLFVCTGLGHLEYDCGMGNICCEPTSGSGNCEDSVDHECVSMIPPMICDGVIHFELGGCGPTEVCCGPSSSDGDADTDADSDSDSDSDTDADTDADTDSDTDTDSDGDTDADTDSDTDTDSDADTDGDTDTGPDLCEGGVVDPNDPVCWQEPFVSGYTHVEAYNYCNGMGLALPSYGLVSSILDNCVLTPYGSYVMECDPCSESADCSAMFELHNGGYWLMGCGWSTPCYVDFTLGTVSYAPSSMSWRVRCIHAI